MHYLQSLEIVLKGVSHQDIVGRNDSKNRRLNLMQLGVYILQQLWSDAAPSGGERGAITQEHQLLYHKVKGGKICVLAFGQTSLQHEAISQLSRWYVGTFKARTAPQGAVPAK